MLLPSVAPEAREIEGHQNDFYHEKMYKNYELNLQERQLKYSATVKRL